jgi:hypothetical protein
MGWKTLVPGNDINLSRPFRVIETRSGWRGESAGDSSVVIRRPDELKYIQALR